MGARVCLSRRVPPCLHRPPVEAGILSKACKHVDFSLALTKLARGARGVNELVFDQGQLRRRRGDEGGRGEGGEVISTQICILDN